MIPHHHALSMLSASSCVARTSDNIRMRGLYSATYEAGLCALLLKMFALP